MKIYLNEQYKCVKVEDNTFVANSTSNFVRYYFVRNADGTVVDEITAQTEVYLNQEPSYVTLGFRRADGNTIQHLMATPKTEGTEAFWEYVITETDGVLYKKGALEVSAQFINATLNSENKIISQKVMAVAINTAHILDNIGEEAEEYYSQYEQANNEAHAALQAQITEKFNNIGVMGSLTTDNKNTLVEAINEVDEHADKAQNDIDKLSADIGNKLSLTTDEKNTIVGAINEVDKHADTAQTTANNASQTANNAKTVADTAKNIADIASQTANEAKTTANNASATANAIAGTANEAKTIAEQAKTIATNSVYSVSFEDIQSAVTALNGYDNAYFKVGNSIYLKQKDVPDMWVYAVASEYVEYTYTTDDDFVNALLLGTVQVGYYVLANLESTGDYDVLKDIPIINQDLSADGFTPVENTYYRHTGTTSATYTAGVIYFYNGTAYKAIDGAGGEVPTSLPATGAKITGNLPTSGWNNLSIPMWEGNEQATNFANAQTLKLKTSWASVSDIPITGWTETYMLAIDSEVRSYIDDGNVKRQSDCVKLSFSTYYYILIYPNGTAKFVTTKSASSENHYLQQIKQENTTISRYTISDDAIKANSTVSMYLNSEDEVRAYSKADGSVVVEMDAVPTVAIPYTLQVVETSAEGAFEIVNSYLPTIPETPTALPQEASALKSGELPTSGWVDTQGYTYNGNLTLSTTNYTLVKTLSLLEYNTITGSLSNNKIKVQEGSKQYTYPYKSSTNTDDKITIYFGTTRSYAEIYIEKSSKKLYAKSSYHTVTALILLYNTDLTLKQYTISDTDITENSDVLMELADEGGVKANALASGSITLIRDTVPTQPIPYTYKVKQTNASGQFTLVNHFVPSIPESPTSLPVTYKKVSGSLPTSGWTNSAQVLLSSITLYENNGDTGVKALNQSINSAYYNYTGLWQFIANGKPGTQTSSPSSIISIAGKKYRKIPFVQWSNMVLYIDQNGNLFSGTKSSYLSGVDLKALDGLPVYTISDTDITENTAVKMYLTDEGGVKAQSKASGSITVIRDSVPTTAIPYEYEVEQTSAEGLFEVINAYVPAVPTKTSELTNDSGFITAADIGNALYPVGSIYMSVNNTNPSTFLGGTWEAWGAGKVPVGVDTNDTDFATVEKTGGEKTHTLTESEIPAHRHTVEAIGTGTTQQELNAFSVDNQGAVDSYGTTNTAGGGQAHNNLQPYITCYMWKRTA